MIICTGNVEPSPYISANGNVPRAGLEMSVLDIDLDIVRDGEQPDHGSDGVEPVKKDKVAAIA